MAREFLVLWAGRHERRGWEELCADYRGRIERYAPIQDRRVKARGDGAARRKAEGDALLAALPDPCWTIALDPRARPRSSEKLAADLTDLRETWPHPIAFLIGSDVGLEPAVVEQSRERLSFGPMVFGHELARLMLYEQIYRALCIERGIKYHRQPL